MTACVGTSFPKDAEDSGQLPPLKHKPVPRKGWFFVAESKAGGEHVAERDQLLTFPFFPLVPIQETVRQFSGHMLHARE